MKKIILTHLLLLTHLIQSQAQVNLTELGHHTFADRLTEVYAYVDEGGAEYAIVGLENSIVILEVSNPAETKELFNYALHNSLYRDIQVYNDYAYIVDESGIGLSIMDLSQLPDAAPYYLWKGDGITSFTNGHNIVIQEDGTAFILGARPLADGALVLDLNSDPRNPVILGKYEEVYIDNAFIRQDTLYAAQIFEGTFSILDFSDPTSPQVLATQPTPSGKAHSCWLNEIGNHLFVIDEFPSGGLTAFNLQNLEDIEEMGSYRSGHSENSMMHQLALIGNTLVLAHYTDGVILVDVSHPEALVEVGHFDTSPLEGSGLRGCWGADPFLPSGNILVVDKEEGLFILCPNYIQAAYVEGSIKDATTGSALFNVEIKFKDERANTKTSLFGTYTTGVAAAGTYDISFVKSGYCTITQKDISLKAGEKLTLNIEMQADDGSCSSDEIVMTSNPIDSLTQCAFIFNGINEGGAINNNINVFPNPSSGTFYVTLKEVKVNTPHIINVYDISGHLLLQKEINKQQSSIQLPTKSGIYLVEMRSKDGIWVEKMIVE